ncbi:MAG: DUF6134 family protein [Longimicrobiales bacterium]|nr:DUF6134 family protein [Longimicrobiales bacterium]
MNRPPEPARRRIGLPSAFVLLLIAGALPRASVPVAAQVVPVDDAVFVLFRNGQRVGEEHVTLHRMGLGQNARVIGQSEIRMDDGSEMRPRVEASPDLRPTAYENRLSGSQVGEVLISRSGRRLVARTRTADGEAQREFRASDRTVILAEDVVLLYYLLAPWARGEPTDLTVLDPRSGSQRTVRVVVQGAEPLRVGRISVVATRIRLESEGDVRSVWFDDEGRVLRVEAPASGLRAERQGS